MKKYEKPLLIIESFQLDAAVAGNCRANAEAEGYQYIKLNYGENTCAYGVPSDDYFKGRFYNYDNCEEDLTGPENDGNDGYCYHGPTYGIVFIHS